MHFALRTVILGSSLAALALSAFGQQSPPPPIPSPTPAPASETPTAPAAAATPSTPAPASQTDRVTVTGRIPVPKVGEGAPYHSAEDLNVLSERAQEAAAEMDRDVAVASDSPTCADPMRPSFRNPPRSAQTRNAGGPFLQELLEASKEAAMKVSALAGKAAEATRKADDSRALAASGDLDMASVEKIELERQEAVTKLEAARQKSMEADASVADFEQAMWSNGGEAGWADVMAGAVQRTKEGWGVGLPRTKPPKNLEIGAAQVGEMKDPNGRFVRVLGLIRNTGDKPISMPALVISLLDERGKVLRNTNTSANEDAKIPAGSTTVFRYDIRPSLEHVEGVAINFASQFEPEGFLPVRLLCPANPPSQSGPGQ